MTDAWLDTDVIIRFLTGDDTEKQRRAQALFEQVEDGRLTVRVPQTVIADAVYVLHSKQLYNRTKREVAELLLPLVQLPHLRIYQRGVVVRALQLYGALARLDFTDALLVALMEGPGPSVAYSWDTDYDGIAAVTRREPEIGPARP